MKQILKNIAAIRNEKSITQEKIADLLSIDISNYSKLENGISKLTVDRLAKIAEIFNMEIIDLITYPKKYIDSDLLTIEQQRNLKPTTKVLVELEVSNDEFLKFGLKEKMLQILNK